MPNIQQFRLPDAGEGLTEAEIVEELTHAGTRVGLPAGEVAAQDPPSGEAAKRGTEVDLTISSGPPKQGQVGLDTGSGMLRSSDPSGAQRLSTPAEMPALQ